MRKDHPTVPGETKALSKGNGFSSIQGRLVGLLLLVLVPILVSQAYFSYDRYQFRKKIECSANLELAQATAKAFDTFVRDVLHHELAIGLAFTSSQTLSDTEKSRILFDNQAGNSAIWNFFWNNPEGIATAATGSQFIGIDISDRQFYREIVAGKEWVVSDLILSKTTQQPIFTISRGIRNERGELLGIIVAGILPGKLDKVLAVDRQGDAGVSLLDSKGMHVYRFPAVQYTWEQRNWLKFYPIIKEALNGKEVVTNVTSQQTGIKRMAAFVPVPSIGWIASCSRAEEEVVGPIISDTLQVTGIILFVALASLLVAVALSRNISSSVNTLRNYALSLGQGETQNPLTIAGPAEYKDLAEAFNKMAEEICSREMALRESEERFRALYEHSTDAIVLTDPRHGGKVVTANPAACTLFGWSEAELMGKTREELFDLNDPAIEALVQRRQSAGVARGELTYRRKDGSTFPGEVNAALFINSHGEPRSVSVIRDMSERKKAEEALRESEERIKMVLRASSIGTFEVNLQTGEGQWNDEEFGLLGLKPGDVPSNPETFFQYVHPHDVGTLKAKWEDALLFGELDAEFRIVRADGQERWLAGKGKFLYDVNDKNHAVRFLGVNFDITNRKQAEEALRAAEELARQRLAEIEDLYHNAPVGLCVLDRDLRFLRVNERLAEINGIPAADHMGKTVRDVLPGLADAVEPRMRRILETGEPRLDIEIVSETPAHPGLQRSWLEQWLPIKDSEGRVTGLSIVVEEITERKKAEENIKASLAEKEVLLKEIHHRVKNNLQVISSLVSLQADSLTDELIRDELNDVRDRVRSMALIHEKLYQTGDLAQLDLADYATSLMHTLWRSHSTLAKNARLNLAVEPVSLSIDTAVPCGLILNELAGNALKHAFPNDSSGEVEVGFSIDPATKVVCLRVRDNGVGLPAGFDWSQSEGLGLQLVKILAGQLHGTVENETGPGTEFKITFPLKELEQ